MSNENNVDKYIYYENDNIELSRAFSNNTDIDPNELPKQLTHFTSKWGRLTHITWLPDTLIYLNLSNNSIEHIDYFPKFLKTIKLQSNKLQSLPQLPPELTKLDCSVNLLNKLPILPHTLTYLRAEMNTITEIPTFPPQLVVCKIFGNSLTHLPTFPDTIKHIDCGFNSISRLPPIPHGTITLNCESNANIVELNNIPNTLKELHISRTSIKILPKIPLYMSAFNFKFTPLYWDFLCHISVIYPSNINLYHDTFMYEDSFITIDGITNLMEYSIVFLNKLSRFREQYYLMKYRDKFRYWLWEKVRRPTIEDKYSPANLKLLLDTMENSEDEEEFNKIMEKW